VYHPVSTGYAGLLAALGKVHHGAGMMLTEHGLYTREREIEIAQAEWIYREPGEGTAFVPYEPFFKGWWRNQYRFLGQRTYDMCDRIVTLHEANKRLQILAGAEPEKLVVVPNGIYPESFVPTRVERDWSARPFRVGHVGRVVPIKDVKTFIRAVQIASMQVPIEATVLGPTDEDAAYFAECEALVSVLGMTGKLKFVGKQDLRKALATLDLNVLTSVSESQPLTILEAAASGVPTVATNVGACREMLEGKNADDALLGPSGLVTPVASPGATASAIVELARDPERYAEMAAAGLKRVERYYRQDDVFAYDRRAYGELAGAGAGKGA
jgi:glycosyltransferase involved in cell wall biosynthesis